MTTASQAAKAAGFTSLKEVADIFGCTTETLRHWHKNKPHKLEIVLIGCKGRSVENG